MGNNPAITQIGAALVHTNRASTNQTRRGRGQEPRRPISRCLPIAYQTSENTRTNRASGGVPCSHSVRQRARDLAMPTGGWVYITQPRPPNGVSSGADSMWRDESPPTNRRSQDRSHKLTGCSSPGPLHTPSEQTHSKTPKRSHICQVLKKSDT